MLRDPAHTMLASRSTLRKSIFFTAGSHDEVPTALRKDGHNVFVKPSELQRELIFVFTGQGAQWVQMGKSLADHCHLFNSALHKCDHILSGLLQMRWLGIHLGKFVLQGSYHCETQW